MQHGLSTLKFPTDWKKAKVTAIYKMKGSKSNCSNYRPIPLLSIPSKIVENLVCSQLKSHLYEHNLQSEHQWGFRPARSTEDALLYMTEKWRKNVDDGQVVGVLFVDFQKAFDSVSHKVLLKKLAACGVTGNFLEYIQNYLSNRIQFTVVNGSHSSEANVEFGVPQGSLIGPPSFSVNVNDMADNIDCDLDQFADDSTIHCASDSVDEVLNNLQRNVIKLQTYAVNNSMTIHPEKCEIVIISRNRFTGPLPKVVINGKAIEIKESSKCLGLTIDQNLTWEAHAKNIVINFSAKVKKLYQMRGMSLSTLSTIYHQGILPSVLYGICIWGNCSPTILENIEKIHTRAARFIHRVKRTIPDIHVLQQVGWIPIVEYYKRNIACKTYKIYNELSSPLLKKLLTKSTSTRVTRNALKLDTPVFHYAEYKRSFSYRSAYVWNNLPMEIREKKSYEAFKLSLKKSNALKKIYFTKFNSGKALDYQQYVYY